MRPGILIPALAFGAALLAPPFAEADSHRAPERGRRSGYERAPRSHGRYQPGHSRHGYQRGHPRQSYRRGHPGYERGHRYRPVHRHRRPYYRPRHPGYYRPGYGPRPVYRPWPRRYYAPWPGPYGPVGPVYGPWPPPRGGVHGSVSIGLPFVGFSLYF